MLSATTDVSKESIVPKPAKVIAGIKVKLISEKLRSSSDDTFIDGNPDVISPIKGISKRKKKLTNEPNSKAISVLGIILVIFGVM